LHNFRVRFQDRHPTSPGNNTSLAPHSDLFRGAYNQSRISHGRRSLRRHTIPTSNRRVEKHHDLSRSLRDLPLHMRRTRPDFLTIQVPRPPPPDIRRRKMLYIHPTLSIVRTVLAFTEFLLLTSDLNLDSYPEHISATRVGGCRWLRKWRGR